MSKAEFTPGPWKLGREDHCNESDSDYIEIDAAGPSRESGLALVFLGHPTGPRHMRDGGYANAHLIAAAPDLYEAVRALIGEVEGAFDWSNDEPGENAYLDAARDAIDKGKSALAKARGEAAS